MKNIKLMNLTLKNFKGIKNLEILADGQDMKIWGDNATGKTSIFDGFLYLLFGKDSNNKSDFAIKTLEDGKEINNLEHEVDATFTVDNVPLSLRKIYKEKWTKKRGAPMAEFTGHETLYYIDSVPVKKKEYEEKVGSIVKEEVFKLLTNPLYFNEQVKWQDRRATLLEVCGDVELEDVLAFNEELKDLPAILKGRTIEDHRKVIASKRAEINKELDRIPVRIDELNNASSELVSTPEQLQVELTKVEIELDKASAQINNIKNGAAATNKKNDLRQIEMDLEAIKRELESEATEEGYKVQAKIQEEKSNQAIMQRKLADANHQIEVGRKDVMGFDEKLVALREDFAAEDAKQFEHKEACECPTCGQSLPEDQLTAARDKAVAEFNTTKSNKLESIQKTGKAIAADKEETLKRIATSEKTVEQLKEDIAKKEEAINKLTIQLNALRDEVKNARTTPKYTDKVAEMTKVQEEIKALESNVSESIAELETEIVKLKAKRSELNSKIAAHDQVKASEKRVAELEEQQKELATEFENLERELYLTEQFIRSKVELLESKINSKFKYARFKLFAQQVNGGLQEICETTMNGIPFSSGLNNAARINVGIDIINTLSEHYGIQAPIFVDNAEAVTRIADTDSQLISLVVSEPDKQLRVETQSNEESVVA
ncbi:hypothetical protein CSV80_00695 [Sporosarcina sp. P12(2017)]|uniref:AAA family ATPase n=1 Tax=unclassified Sporosarcina TaxID=2647733 RepID=UPI000C170805|nr:MULTISPECIES: AAA family ATPase [unclassified Sporosarcina]PIC59074.1 hypothetical protein CSV81_00695 [Sporosarcina sp. P10]PIC62395.1 hypothetical protein CSV80_00695 [Sporosarcina sp. P12(2017)]